MRSNGLHYVYSLIHKNLARLYKDEGDINKCSYHLEMASKEEGNIYSTNNNVNISEAQLRANNKFFLERLFYNITFWLCVAAGIVLAIVLYFYRKLRHTRTAKLKQEQSLAAKSEELQSTTEKLTKAKKQISTLKRESAKKSDKIEKLNTTIVTAVQNAEDNVRRGKELFKGIVEDGCTTVKWTNNDYEQCLAYCKIEFAATYAKVEKSFGNIAPRKLLTILLYQLGHDYTDIGRIMAISPDSARKSLTRMLQTNEEC